MRMPGSSAEPPSLPPLLLLPPLALLLSVLLVVLPLLLLLLLLPDPCVRAQSAGGRAWLPLAGGTHMPGQAQSPGAASKGPLTLLALLEACVTVALLTESWRATCAAGRGPGAAAPLTLGPPPHGRIHQC